MWNAAHAAAYWTDINRFLIHRYTPADKCVRTWFFEEPVTALSLTDRDDKLAVILGSQVILWEPDSDHRSEPVYRLTGESYAVVPWTAENERAVVSLVRFKAYLPTAMNDAR